MNIRSRFAPQCDTTEPSQPAQSPRNIIKRTLRLALLSTLALVGAKSNAHAQGVQVRTTRGLVTAKTGQLLVKFGSSASSSSLTSIRSNIANVRALAKPINSRIGATELQSFGSIGWQLVKLPAGMSLEEGIAFYKSQPGVANVEPDAMRYLMSIPNDPSYSEQYGLEKIGAPAAWNKTKGGGSNTIVAVIDSGVNYSHQDLAANMWKNPKEIAGNGKDDDGNGYKDDVYGIDTGDQDSDPMDVHHHGTHCAGIIGAAGNNGIGVSGVNWKVKIMACKVMNSQKDIPSSSVLEAMQYVLTMKARGNNIRVINESLGGPTYVQAEKDLFDKLNSAGIFVAAAAGNKATNNDSVASYPASYDCPNIISVAASDKYDDVADFSNYGATSVDLAAPGVDIYSTFWPGNSAYSNLSGTSMATPMVAGAAALLSSFGPTQSPATLRKLLMDTVDAFPQWDGKVVSGGRLNLARALNAVDPGGLPTVISATPHGVVNALRPSIVVNFSKPMNTSSVQSNWSFAPAVSGSFAWSNGNKTVTFTPNGNLTAGTSYEGRIKGTATSAAGVKLDGNLSQTSTGSPDDDYGWSFRVTGAPSNDNFAKAMSISGDSGYVPSFNMGATREAGEPGHGNYYGNGNKSVWFKWTAPTNGNLIFDTTGSTFSHVIAVYTGSSVGALNTQKTGDSDFTGRSVRIELRASVGRTYYIAIDGDYYPPTETTPAFTDEGNIHLAWQFYRSPSNDYYASAQNISGTKGSVTGNTLGAYSEDGDGGHIGSGSSVWYRWTAPANGAVTFDTEGSEFNTSIIAAVGTPIGNATQVAQDHDGGRNYTSVMPFTVSAGTTYYISVGGEGYAFNDARGNFKLNWNFVNAPSNDNFSRASVLSLTSGGTVTTSTYGASRESNDPDIEFRPGSASIWYTWTAPADGAVTFDTKGSSYDTNLGAFTGSSISNLLKVDDNDDNASIESEKTSKIKFTAVKGTTYRIYIDSRAYVADDASIGYPARHGTVRLTWGFANAPSNDDFVNAQNLPTLNGGITGSLVGASVEEEEPDPGYTKAQSPASIWYAWKAPSDGAITFDTAGSFRTNGKPLDTNLAVYVGNELSDLGFEPLDDNDDDESNAPSVASRVRFTVRAGLTYRLRISNQTTGSGDSSQVYNDTHGSVALAWSFVGAPGNDNFNSYTDLGSSPAGSVSGTTYGAGLEPDEDNPTFRDTSGSVWYRWTAPISDSVTFSTAGSKNLRGEAYDTQIDIYTGDSLDNLDWVNENRDDGSSPTSKLTIKVEAGVTYIIRVDGEPADTSDSVRAYNYVHGIINLSWSLPRSTSNGPTISNFSPSSGNEGTAVTINGSNLGGTTNVWFDGIAAPINSVSATSVSATAPANVRTGRISLKTGNGSATSTTDFKVVPTISTFSPATGTVGTQVTVDGTGFVGVTKVTIGGANAAFTIVSSTRLTAIVPSNAVNGKVTVTTAGGTAQSSGVFSMPPRIDSFSPESGSVGTRVQIKGANFTSDSSVLFNGLKATSLSITTNSISVTVPAGATTGPISVVAPAGTAKTTTNFTILIPPVVSSFSPLGGKTGTSVTISGSNFSGATSVRFNGIEALNPTVSATSIVAIVPDEALTGPISVETSQGVGKSKTSFIVDNAGPIVVINNPADGATLTALPKTFGGTVSDNSGVSNVSSLTWNLSRTTTSTVYWNASNNTWGNLVNNATTPTRPSSDKNWATSGNLPSGANLTAGSYILTVTAADKWGNTTTVISTFNVPSAPAATYAVTGRITVGTAGLGGVAISSNTGLSATTNANGDFTLSGATANTTITITAALLGYSFNPTSRSVAVKTANVTGQNFAATKVSTPVTPTITSFSPASGPVGTLVTITGTNLANATSVKFNGAAAVIKSKTATQVVATVPTGATTGTITVTTSNGTATSKTAFTVTTADDTTPPVVKIVTPAAESTVSSLPQASGTASDVGTGVKTVFLKLYRADDTGTQLVSVYDWATKSWITDSDKESTLVTATGTTNWKLTMPPLSRGIYFFYATAADGASTPNLAEAVHNRFGVTATGITNSAGAS